MKEYPNIDELLNGFIDGELTARQQTEVQRLITHDVQVSNRLKELKSCRTLLGCLPRAEAPAQMAEDVKARLERRMPLDQPERSEHRRGTKHLLIRRILSYAAMIGLVAALGIVVYTIVAPQSSPKELIIAEHRQKPGPSPTVVLGQFKGTLELKTANLIAVDAFIRKTLADNNLLEYTGPAGQKNTYTLNCSREIMGLLLTDLASVWPRLESTTLFVKAADTGQDVMVGQVNTKQLAMIINQTSLKDSIKVAKDFAISNDKLLATAIDSAKPDLITIPKPSLTSNHKTPKELQPVRQVEDEEKISLTIIVKGLE